MTHVANAMNRITLDIAETFVIGLVPAALILGAMMALEHGLRPARPRSGGNVGTNLAYTVALLAIVAAMRPLTLAASLAVSRTLGLGYITFTPGVAGWIAAFVCLLLATDLLEYLWHRAQHRFGPLWKMHELHHSADHFNVTLSYMHFWLEPLIKASLLYPLIGVAFNVPFSVATAVGWIFMINHHVAHLNTRIHFGRLAWLVSSPHYHRSHHSRHEEHYNKNYCDLLPLWDHLFGSFEPVAQDRFVDVGINSVEPPRALTAALVWPWRRVRAEAHAGPSAQQDPRSPLANPLGSD